MPDHQPTIPPVPSLVEEWIRANPFPIVIVAAGDRVIASNEALDLLLQQMNTEVPALIRQFLLSDAEPVDSDLELIDVLDLAQCVIKQVSLTGDREYVSHVVKLEMEGGPCLCCILMPGEDPSQTYLQGILNTITTFVVEIDSLGNVRYLNDQLLHHLGYEPDDRPALTHLADLQPTYAGAQLDRRLEEVERHGVSYFRTSFRTTERKRITMEASLVRNQVPGDSSYLLTARDITLQIAHEQTLRDDLVQANREKLKLERENVRLRAQASDRAATSSLVYRSKVIAEVVDRIRQVAPTDTSVLIIGEPGTGKELVARTIHRLSRRSEHPLITVDCGALPPDMLESELFGYQTGAFTGVYRDRLGRFEAAHGGTILLDGIDKMSLRLQRRVLHILQRGEFMPPDKTDPLQVDVRLLAATDADLRKRAEEGKFRSDLLHRLNDYTILSPPLRERTEDILPLISHFVRKFNEKFSRDLMGPDKSTIDHLRQYDFPGNVAELENMVERAVMETKDGKLRIFPHDTDKEAERPLLHVFDGQITQFLSFEEYQRKYIELVLKSTDGKVSGAGGAAEILRMNPQTLFSKMKKLGIRR